VSILNTLYARLAVSLLVLVALLGAALLGIAHYISDMYSQEVTQRLNQSIAMYVTEEQQLISEGVVNQPAIDELAHRVMTINPTVEVYLIDDEGGILAHLLPEDAVQQDTVSLEPVREFLSGSATLPVFGDDPRTAGAHKVFSVSPIVENGNTTGYLYAVLGGAKYESLQNAVQESYILQVGAMTIIGSLLLALLSAMAIFFYLTRRLARLRQQIDQFQMNEPDAAIIGGEVVQGGDEIDQLARSFSAMARHIQQQFQALQSLDSTRRELIANVSHDLRTPLASMQGYIETLIIKEAELPEETRRHYLQIAFKHSQRLNDLIGELFELAKLDSGAVEVNAESFSLMELVHDCVQDFELVASEKDIDVKIVSDSENCFVVADIALIQRVLQNLVSNALRHTPPGHSVTIGISDDASRALIEVSDTGQGIASHEIPHIFERFYYSQQKQPSEEIGSGLGLAIVKRILELHQSTIRVSSELDRGTSFTFELPLQAA
jgi:two-component system, OmpR family, sensor kinase